MLWPMFLLAAVFAIGFLMRHATACDEKRRWLAQIDDLCKRSDGHLASCLHERSRADANYEEAKRHKERADKAERELAEANRKLGFVRRAVNQDAKPVGVVLADGLEVRAGDIVYDIQIEKPE